MEKRASPAFQKGMNTTRLRAILVNDRPIGGGVLSTGHIQLLQDAVDMILDGPYLDEQAICDLLITEVLTDQFQHFALTWRQLNRLGDRGRLVEQLRQFVNTGHQGSSNFGRDQRLTIVGSTEDS